MQHHLSRLKEKSRQLRRYQTPAEESLWHALRDRRFLNLKFRRQQELGYFILDFYCEDLKLAIELDGAPHFDEAIAKRDSMRTEFLQKQGITVVRIENNEWMLNSKLVLARLERIVEELKRLSTYIPRE